MQLFPITEVSEEIIESFSCFTNKYETGQEDLIRDHEKIDNFLKNEALSHHLKQLVRTYLLLNDVKNEVIGFFSLYNEEISISTSQKSKFKYKSEYKSFLIYTLENTEVYPAIRLHQFAIDKNYQGKYMAGEKYSDYLIGKVFQTVTQVAEKTGCTFIGLEATDNAIKFYEDYEFRVLTKKSGKKLPYLIFKVEDLL